MTKENELLDPRYRQVRQTAEQLNSRMPADHPCQRGNGECCMVRDLAMTMDDLGVIAEGIANEDISQETLHQAMRNEGDEENQYCPFFDRTNRVCTIYEYRPLVCVSYGMGASPESQDVYDAAVTSQVQGEDAAIPLFNCDHVQMCQSCIITQGIRDVQIPLQDVQDSQTIKSYLEETNTFSTASFVRALPRLYPDLNKTEE